MRPSSVRRRPAYAGTEHHFSRLEGTAAKYSMDEVSFHLHKTKLASCHGTARQGDVRTLCASEAPVDCVVLAVGIVRFADWGFRTNQRDRALLLPCWGQGSVPHTLS